MGKVVKLEIVDKHRKSFFDVLPDNLLDNKVGFTGAWRTQHQYAPEWVDDIYPTIAQFAPALVGGFQVDGILVLQEPLFLWKGFVPGVEDVALN
ncbi:hypothetical protein BUE76_22360 [Cnuella takakiae]|nr:hypothetical protein BUE76_22360 [Cnuella takakiae]